ncbi:unnamed protein product [Camellia sinensis]
MTFHDLLGKITIQEPTFDRIIVLWEIAKREEGLDLIAEEVISREAVLDFSDRSLSDFDFEIHLRAISILKFSLSISKLHRVFGFSFLLGSIYLNLSQVARATQNFSPSMKIGEGGFGIVYKALLPGGQVVAIKRAKKGMAEYQMPLFREIGGCLKAKCDRLTDAFEIDDIDISSVNINNFGCKFPEYIGNLLRNLEYLNLDHNHIFGSIPPGIVNLVGLQSLNMQLNQFSGSILSEIGKLQNLYRLNLDNNSLSEVEAIQVNADEGGFTQTRGGIYWVILPAGCCPAHS